MKSSESATNNSRRRCSVGATKGYRYEHSDEQNEHLDEPELLPGIGLGNSAISSFLAVADTADSEDQLKY